jgi:hypothetical protein
MWLWLLQLISISWAPNWCWYVALVAQSSERFALMSCDRLLLLLLLALLRQM